MCSACPQAHYLSQNAETRLEAQMALPTNRSRYHFGRRKIPCDPQKMSFFFFLFPFFPLSYCRRFTSSFTITNSSIATKQRHLPHARRSPSWCHICRLLLLYPELQLPKLHRILHCPVTGGLNNRHWQPAVIRTAGDFRTCKRTTNREK